ncbi:MAG: hypothetical protein K9M03_01320 [Kiritimatiellales bacterium]|nr:hypothetical protein [Kiritimatiellales bacterium]
MINPLRSSLFKQLCGAVAGAALAYGLYVGYQAATPRLSAYIDVFWSDTDTGARFATKEPDEFDRQLERQASRNNEIRERFAAPTNQPGMNAQPNAFDDIADRAKQFEEQLTEEDIADLVEPEEEVPVSEGFEVEVAPPIPDPSVQWEQEWDTMKRETVDSGDDLPDSGIGMWMAAVAALGGASALRKKRKTA